MEKTEIWLYRGYGTGKERLVKWAMSRLPQEGDGINFNGRTYSVDKVYFDMDSNEIRIHVS